MTTKNWQEIITLLREQGIGFDVGLTDNEIAATENRFGFQFPSDLRAFLQTALPRGDAFPDWRNGSESDLREWLDLPLRGILFDVENNQFWLEEWGPRPATLAEATRVVNNLVAAAPQLIPIYHHRVMPAEPTSPGNPVFSVHQTDIIIYGADLEAYLRGEFNLTQSESHPSQIRPIRFWNIDRFQEVRWGHGSCASDPSTLPEEITNAASHNQSGAIRKRWWQFWK
jgi:hypothetical protein